MPPGQGSERSPPDGHTPRSTPTADRTVVDYEHRNVKISAPVTVTDPATGALLDPSGVAVTLKDPDDPTGVGVTGAVGADGRLTVPVTEKGPAQYQVFNADGSTAGYPFHLDTTAPSQTVLKVVASPEQTRIRILSGSNLYLPKDGHGTIKGILERKVGTAWVGTPKQQIWSVGSSGGGPTVTTAADGTFQVPADSAGSWYFANYWDYDPYLQSTDSSATPVYVHIPAPSSITPFHVTENEYSEAYIDGHLAIGGTFADSKHTVTIQFSADGKTWHNVGTTRIGRSGLAGDEFACYGTYRNQANGYWRAYFPGTPDFSPSYSHAVKVYRMVTRVTGGRPNHTTVRKNSYVSFGGHVQGRSSTGVWSPIRHSYVSLVFRPYKGKTWYYVSRARTDSAGAYHLRGKATRGGTWAVVWFTPDGSHLDSNGPQTYVHV